jgi:alpha-galactosidase
MAGKRRLAAGFGALAIAAGLVAAVSPGRALARDNGLARTPPMGWNGYNHFSRNVTASIVDAEARAIVSSGMKAAGYTYVNLDGGWNLLQRSAGGELQADPAKFPHGIKAVADYVHALGLKFGIYASAGTTNCAGTAAGSYGHYRTDAKTFASWGVDYAKFDYCAIPYQDYPGLTRARVGQLLSTQMGQALAATGRPIVYDVNDSIAGTTHAEDWTWAPKVANLWRVMPDIKDSYASLVSHFCACDLPAGSWSDVQLSPYARPGAWNDPDMLEVGNGGMTATEDRSEFSLWAEMAAPLIAGNDLSTMSAAARQTLTNRAVIAVDQDPLGRQGYPVTSAGNHWVLAKPLAGGDRAVLLFNETGRPAVITTSARQAGLPSAPTYVLRDLWRHTVSRTAGLISAEVPAHAVVMYRVTPGASRQP